jgi:kinesin family protein 18/19
LVLDRVQVECENEGRKPDVLHRSREQRYFFDRIFNQYHTTHQVYDKTASPLIESVLRGYNACVFAYGTTGSGKTYTMTGTEDTPGIMYLIIESMFDKIHAKPDKKYEIRVSYVEIYNEVIRDLLVPNSKDTYLELRDDHLRGIVISGVNEFSVGQPDEVMELLVSGNKRRTTESTKANLTSSRSHAIL